MFKLTLVNDRVTHTHVTVLINEEQFQKLFSSYNIAYSKVSLALFIILHAFRVCSAHKSNKLYCERHDGFYNILFVIFTVGM